MTAYDSHPIGDAARGVVVRAGLLAAVTLVVATFLFTVVLKAAGALVKLATGLLLLTIGGGLAAFEVKRLQRRLSGTTPRAIS